MTSFALPLVHHRRSDRILLAGGIASSFLYAFMLIVIPRYWAEYSASAQTVSELSAIGAPTRAVWATFGGLYAALIVAFGIGIIRDTQQSTALRRAGWVIAAFGSLGILWPFASMHLRGVIAAGGATWSDRAHIVLGITSIILMASAIWLAADALGETFYHYSLVTLALVFVFGAVTAFMSPAMSRNEPTPWMGVWERISIGAFLLWIAILSRSLQFEARSWPIDE